MGEEKKDFWAEVTDESLMCPICGGLHPSGHRDKELEDKLDTIKSWYETRIRECNEQIDAARTPPDISIVQDCVSRIFLKGLEGLGEILEAED